MARRTPLGVMLLLLTLLVPTAPAQNTTPSSPPPSSPTTAPSWNPGDLQAHGSDERLWLARVEPVPGRTPTDITYVYMREKSDATWRRLEPLGLRVMGMANRGSQLALLLPGGDWRLTTEAGYASGGPLPEGAKLLVLGSDASTLWAIGLSRADSAATTTQSTTSPTTQSLASSAPGAAMVNAAPASRPGATSAPSGQPKLLLYRLGAKDWEKQGELPDEIPPSESVSLSLGVVGGTPLLAYKLDDRTIRIWHRGTAADDWDSLPDVKSQADIAEHKLLSGTASPILWYRGASGPGHLWIAPSGSAGGRGGSDKMLAALPGVPADAPRAVAFANNAVREILIADGKIYEQRLNPSTGAPEGEPALAVLPAASFQGLVVRVLEFTLAIALVLALMSSMRRRGELTEGELDPSRFRLAPHGLRLTAGLIDAIPIFVASGLTWARPSGGQPTVNEWIILTAGIAVYLLLTTVVELAAGRSIGKMLTGLHIVGLDGRPATAGARLLRNLFRIIDILIAGMPLALILFSPLRQRAGDLGAGTVVVQGRAEGRSEPADNSDDTPARRRRSDADSD